MHYNLPTSSRPCCPGGQLLSFAVFWVVKLLVFNRLFKVELEEFDEHLTIEEPKEYASD